MNEKKSVWKLVDYIKIIPALIIAVVIFYFSSLSNPLPPAPPSPLDHLNIGMLISVSLHAGEFGALSFFMVFGLNEKVKSSYLIILSIFYAILDEVHQYFVPNRYFDVFDIMVDILGIFLGVIFYLILYNSIHFINKKNINE